MLCTWFWSILWNMHKVSLENTVFWQSYRSLYIDDKLFWLPVQHTAVTQWCCFDAVVYTINILFSANDYIVISVSRQEKWYSAKNLLQNFPTNWTLKLLQNIDVTINTMKHGNEWKRMISKKWGVIDEAVKQWCQRLPAYIWAQWRHFEPCL